MPQYKEVRRQFANTEQNYPVRASTADEHLFEFLIKELQGNINLTNDYYAHHDS